MDAEIAFALGLKVEGESKRLDWIQLTHDKYRERDIAIPETKFLVIYKTEIFLNSLTTIRFSR
jgi:hypothetical protein